jgi:hypothetical protein
MVLIVEEFYNVLRFLAGFFLTTQRRIANVQLVP